MKCRQTSASSPYSFHSPSNPRLTGCLPGLFLCPVFGSLIYSSYDINWKRPHWNFLCFSTNKQQKEGLMVIFLKHYSSCFWLSFCMDRKVDIFKDITLILSRTLKIYHLYLKLNNLNYLSFCMNCIPGEYLPIEMRISMKVK